MPRRTSKRASNGERPASALSFSTTVTSGLRKFQRIASARGLLFFLVGIVDENAVVIVGFALQPLECLIPVGRDFIEKHHALARKSDLDKTHLAHKLPQPPCLFQVFFIHVFDFLKPV